MVIPATQAAFARYVPAQAGDTNAVLRGRQPFAEFKDGTAMSQICFSVGFSAWGVVDEARDGPGKGHHCLYYNYELHNVSALLSWIWC